MVAQPRSYNISVPNQVLARPLLIDHISQAGDPTPRTSSGANERAAQTATAGVGIGLYAAVLVGALGAYLAYAYLQRQETA